MMPVAEPATLPQEQSSGQLYDVAIVGGGLAGLALSIQLARKGWKVIVYEKEKYPFHKVCGEYMSLESWDFLESLGLPLSSWDIPIIKNVIVTSPKGKLMKHSLGLGGLGISRYKLDAALAEIAKASGVLLKEETRVNDITQNGEDFIIAAEGAGCRARIAVSCFGKRSNLDIKWERPFIFSKKTRLSNYVAVKYHVRSNFPADTIALHNFRDGYCGMARIEEGKYCLCYMVKSALLLKNKRSIPMLERNELSRNKHLKKIFEEMEPIYDAPLTISQVSFDKKKQVEDHILMVGDAAGMITPLCGNGMSMALHGSKIAFTLIDRFLKKRITRAELEKKYVKQWKKEFGSRLRMGRMVQSLFGHNRMTGVLVGFLKTFPGIATRIIAMTHGKPF